MELIAKHIISGEIHVLTGLHIGGSKTSLEIGTIDNPVIKTPSGEPYIPGSSLKGKMRSLLAKIWGSPKVEDDAEPIYTLFGQGANTKKQEESDAMMASQLIFRDAMLSSVSKELFKEGKATESKWENSIERLTGVAGNPRQSERVPEGVVFEFEIIYDEYKGKEKEPHFDTLRYAMKMLERDYLGGSGTRGYGKIKFAEVNIAELKIDKENMRDMPLSEPEVFYTSENESE